MDLNTTHGDMIFASHTDPQIVLVHALQMYVDAQGGGGSQSHDPR